MLRKALATIAGVVAGVIVITIVEAIGHRIWPPAHGMVVIEWMSSGALAFIVLAWALGSFVAGLVAGRIGRSLVPALIAGGLFVVAGIATMLKIPHPVWMWVMAIVLPVPAAWLGATAAMRRS